MTTSFWSVKGGVGVSTVAAMFAIARASRAEPSLIVDFAGDQPALLGLPDPVGPGVTEWCATPNRSSDALARVSTEISVDLSLLHRGADRWGETEPGQLHQALRAQNQHVMIDAGRADHPFTQAVVAQSEHRLLVLRCCYLALHAARSLPIEPTGIVLVRERGRSLGPADAEAVTAAPVVAEIALDPAIARCIDAGLIARRLPRALLRNLAKAPAHAAA